MIVNALQRNSHAGVAPSLDIPQYGRVITVRPINTTEMLTNTMISFLCSL